MLGIEPRFVSSSNFFGRTALHLAAASGNMEMVVLLCSRDAPPNSLMIYKVKLKGLQKSFPKKFFSRENY